MRVIRAITPVGDQIPVVLQHVEMVVRDDALHFFLSPLLGLRYSQIDSLSLEGLRFPVLRKVGHHPSANSWIASVQGPALGGETRLSPIDPETELEPVLVRIVGDGGEAVGKLLRIGVPVTHAAKPASIDVKHLQSKLGGVANHTQGNLFVDRHAAAPAVVDCPGIVEIVPGFRIAEHGAHPAAQDVSRTVGPIAEAAEKHNRSLKRFSGREARTEGAGIGVQAQGSVQRVLRSLQRDAGSAAEFDSAVPSGLREIFSLYQRPGNRFAGLVVAEIAISAGRSGPMIALGQSYQM